MNQVKLLKVSDFAKLPTKATEGSAYWDLYSTEKANMSVGQTRVFNTGWKIEVPKGYFLDIRSRSGLSVKGIFVTNSPAVIDSDYRGDLKIILTYANQNAGLNWHEIEIGDRIAQCALMPVIQTEFVPVHELSETNRGENGLGSSGR